MVNSVAVAKQEDDQNFCTIDDVEVVYTGIQDIYTVTDDGMAGDLKETYGDESEFAYYYCQGCETDWARSVVQSQEQAWELVKAHLSE